MIHVTCLPHSVNSAMISNDDMFVCFWQGCPFIFTFISTFACQREDHINLVMTTAIETYVDHRTWKVMQPDPIEWYEMICNMMVWERDFPDTWIFKLHTHLFFLLSTCICYNCSRNMCPTSLFPFGGVFGSIDFAGGYTSNVAHHDPWQDFRLFSSCFECSPLSNGLIGLSNNYLKIQ